MSCSRFSFPTTADGSIAPLLNGSIGLAFNLTTPDQIASFWSNIYCAADTLTCLGICPNADLAGVGVRTAFWLSSTLGAILVAISPEESSQGAWTSAVLTASILIPAIKQKKQQQLSLYHATLVLNFATFSSLVSLAVAPMCTVWRPPEEEEREPLGPTVANPEAEVARFGEEGHELNPDAPHPLTNLPKRKVHRQRIILSLALLTQVSLQWTWVIILFTSTEYAQKVCSPDTIVLMFGNPFTAHEINDHLYILWPIWLLFHLAVTLIWGILLVHSSSPDVHPVLSRSPTRESSLLTMHDRLPADLGRISVLLGNCFAFLIAVLFLVSSEFQVKQNCVRGGENTDWSFGQFAAILVALAPAWSIFTALAKRRLNKDNGLPTTSFIRSVTPDISITEASPSGSATPKSSRSLLASNFEFPSTAIVNGPLDPNYLSVPPQARRRVRLGDDVVPEDDIQIVPR